VSAGRRPARAFVQTATFTLVVLAIGIPMIVLLVPVAGFWTVAIALLVYVAATSLWIAVCGFAWRRIRMPPLGPFVHLTPTESLWRITSPDGSVRLRTSRQTSRPLIWPPRNQPKSLLFLYVGHPARRHVRNNFTNQQIQSGLSAIVIEQLPANASVLRRRSDRAVAIDVDYIGPAIIARHAGPN
jgi:hypothetical protein